MFFAPILMKNSSLHTFQMIPRTKKYVMVKKMMEKKLKEKKIQEVFIRGHRSPKSPGA